MVKIKDKTGNHYDYLETQGHKFNGTDHVFSVPEHIAKRLLSRPSAWEEVNVKPPTKPVKPVKPVVPVVPVVPAPAPVESRIDALRKADLKLDVLKAGFAVLGESKSEFLEGSLNEKATYLNALEKAPEEVLVELEKDLK